MKKYTLFREGNYYKGNLHTHTTKSDGTTSPEETVARYQKNGYSFLALTDHSQYHYYPQFNSDTFLNFPAAEIQSTAGANWWHHLIVFGDPATTKIPNHTQLSNESLAHLTLQELIDSMRATNNLVIYNHPYWSRTRIIDLENIKNLTGMEIYNHGCEAIWKCGNGEVFYEHMLWHENYAWCFGTDDAHGPDCHFCGGYIVVKTDDFSHRGIINAIEKGSFFACGAREGEEAPKVLDFIVEDGVAKVWCEPCRDLYLYAGTKSYPAVGNKTHCEHGKGAAPVTYAEMPLPEDAKFVRATLQDFAGNTTWCQPIVL